MVIYLDLVMLLNFLVDFLLMVAADRLSGCLPQFGRLAAGAAVGGLYGGISMLPNFSFLNSPVWNLIALGSISLIGFGIRKSTLRNGTLFLLLSMALGGIAYGIHTSGLGGLLLSAVGLTVLCRVGFRSGMPEGKLLSAKLCYGGNAAESVALYDTGNTLRDPITGERVLVAGADLAQKLTGLSKKQLENPLETMILKPIKGLRLIPYRSVGQSGAMLLAVRCESAEIGKWKGKCIVAFSPDNLGTTYNLLIGGTL